MAEPFIAEVRMWAISFAPRGWANCDGQLLPIAQNTALFSLIGTTYGGDGRTTTGLPNLQGRAAMHPGNGPGLTSRQLGQVGGNYTEQVPAEILPEHRHQSFATDNSADSTNPSGRMLAARNENSYDPAGNPTPMAGTAVGTTGGTAHNNLQPYLVLRFCIALIGIYPSRD
jgi:microcystin-dependent protein